MSALSRPAVQSGVNSNIYNNTSRYITGQILQDQLTNIIDSFANLITDKNLFNARRYLTTGRSYEADECCVYDDGGGDKIYIANTTTSGAFNASHWDEVAGGSSGVAWGAITGTASSQADLQDGTIQGTFTASNSEIVTNDSFKTGFQKAQGQINNRWAFGGNAIGSATNFGSTDAFDVVFISNNTERARLYSNGRFEHSATFTTSANNQVGFNVFPSITLNAAHTEAFAQSLRPTLVAGANSQILNTLRIRPTFTNGAFTSVVNNYLLIETSAGSRFGQWFVPNGGGVQYHFGSGTIATGRTNWIGISGQLTSTAVNTGLAGLDMSGITLANANSTGTGTFFGQFISVTILGNTPSTMFQYRGSTSYSNTAGQTLPLAYGLFSQHSFNTNHTVTALYAFGSDVEGSTGTITTLAHFRANQTFTGTATNTIGFLVDDVTTGTQTNVAYGFFNKDTNSYNAFNQDTVIGSTNSTNPVPLARLQLIGKNSSSEILRGTSSGSSTRFVADDNGRWSFNNSIVSTATMVVRSVQSTGTDSILDVRAGADTYFKVLHGGNTEFNSLSSGAAKLVISGGNTITQSDTTSSLNLVIGTKNAIRVAVSSTEAAITYGGTSGYSGGAWHEFKTPNNGRSNTAWYDSANTKIAEIFDSSSSGFLEIWSPSSTSARLTASSIGKHGGTGDFTVFNNVSGADLYLQVSGTGRILTAGGKLILAATTTTYASLNVTSGTAPTTPVDGDLWRTSTSWFVRHNSTTYDLLNPTTKATNTYIFGRSGVISNGNIIKAATGDSGYINSQGIPISSNEIIEEVSYVFGDYAAAAASSITISVREFTTSGSGSGTAITSTAGTEKAALTYSTGGASSTTYYRTGQSTGLSASISQGNILFVSITAALFATANDLTVIVKTRKS